MSRAVKVLQTHHRSSYYPSCWLFSDTPAGAEATAIVYTLMETAKANNLRLEDYIEHLLAVLPERFADDLEADIDDLLPWADAMQKRLSRLPAR